MNNESKLNLDKHLSDEQRKALATAEELLKRHFSAHIIGVAYPRPGDIKLMRGHLAFDGKERHIRQLLKILNDGLKAATRLGDRSSRN